MGAPVSVAVYGLGSIGRELCAVILDKPGFELRGAVDISPELVGQELGSLLGREDTDLAVTDSPDVMHANRSFDVSVVTTTSFFEGVRPVVEDCIRSGTDVVSTAEELFYPIPERSAAVAELDALATDHGVTVLSGGMNPGFVFDVLPVTLTGACIDVNHIEVQRFADLTPYRTARSRFGAGLPLETYRERLVAGEIQTHVGMEESLRMIEDALGVSYDTIHEFQEPIMAAEDRQTPHVDIPAGTVAGIEQQAQAIIDDVVFVSLSVRIEALDVDEQAAGRDEITISGTPDIQVTNEPAFRSVEGTIGRTLNAIPAVLEADSGYQTVNDLPPLSAIVGDVGEFLARG